MTSWTDGYVADLGYTHGFYRELTPALLSFVGLAKNIRTPDVKGPLAYCELGCGQGFSANLLAAANPHIEFYATDFNPAHIVGARALARQAGAANVHFFDQSFDEYVEEPSLPQLDIISLHGIYSWVSAENRMAIVRFIRRKLKPGGLVYVSYNALPGWAAAAPLRHLMYLHVQAHGGPTGSRVDPALQFIDELQGTGARYFQMTPALKARFERIKGERRNYLAHEFLNESWTLLYHSDVAAEMQEAKLNFLGSAAPLEHVDSINFTDVQQKLLAEITDPVLRETTRDFMINQQFRRDVFVKGAVYLAGPEARARWLDTRFALSIAREDIPMQVNGALGEAKLNVDVYGPILDAFAGGPRTVRQLLADPRIGTRPWQGIQQALVVLVGAGWLQPALDGEGDSDRTALTRAFNAAVIERAVFSMELTCLASPVTGGGTNVDRLFQLFLLGRRQNQSDVPLFVWGVLKEQGQKLMREGTTIEAPEDNITELRTRYELFSTKHLGVLEQLGIA